MSWTRAFAKYSVAGVVNSVIGYAIIFWCMTVGLSPALSNTLGYAVGLITSFLQSRYWVFRSSAGPGVARDAPRFALAFAVSFAVNQLVLQALLAFDFQPYFAQIGACVSFLIVGFVLNRFYVFPDRLDRRSS